MAYSLVGSAGAVTVGAANAAVTPAWDAGASRTAGNLLVCLVAGWGNGSAATTSGVWDVTGTSSATLTATVFRTVATGGDAAPTVAAVTGMTWAAQLLEFSGNTSTPLDWAAGKSSSSSPLALATHGLDATAGELVVWTVAEGSSVITAAMVEHTGFPNNGMTANNVDNNSTSTANHYLFGWGITTANGVADANSIDFDAGDSATGTMLSFTVAPPPPGTLSGTVALAEALARAAMADARAVTSTLALAQSFARVLHVGSALSDSVLLTGPPAPTPTESNLRAAPMRARRY